MTLAFLLALTALVLALTVRLARQQGRAQMKADKEEEINRAVLNAVLARDRLERDPDYARRLRETFTRRLLPDLSTRLLKSKGHGRNAQTDRRE